MGWKTSPFLEAQCHKTKIDDKVDHRISKASQAFDWLQVSLRNLHDLKLKIKLKIYNAVVFTMPLDGAEALIVYSNQTRKANHFNLSCLRRMLKLRWQDRIPDTDFLRWTGFLGTCAMLG
ncbi:unnamed protein product [Schistocephalus solidus]|uniref:Transposase n=1 Tax=Schistocephalus solidus TaxID=70667 RepID=A0A183SMC3_SCHSO|nr:unnamed protein product [Schistocephalus solidus]